MAKAKKEEPELEIKAKLKGTEEVKEWSKKWDKESWNKKAKTCESTSSALYFVGFIGSVIYWWQAAGDFGAVITGFLKSLVWPAYIVYKLLESFYGVTN